MPNPRPDQVLGYRATWGDDGALTIHDVEIFVTCKRGEHDFNEEWVADAVKHAKAREAEGYLPPLHVRHHEPATEATNAVVSAGFFRVTGARPITFHGKRRSAIFADLIITNEDVQEEVLRKRLPYRSVEIFNVGSPAINGLALLDHEAPFLELPMLVLRDSQRVRRERDNSEVSDPAALVTGGTFKHPWQMECGVNDEAVVASFRRGPTAHLLFRTKEDDTMTTPDDTRNFAEDEKPDDSKAKGGESGGKGEGENMEGDGPDVKTIVKMIEDGSITVADMDLILNAIQKQKGGEGEPEAEEAPANTPAPAATPGEAMKADKDMAAQFAALKGENEALRARMDARDEADACKADVDAAMTRLDGRCLGSDLNERLTAFRKDHGAEAFKAYVDGMAKTAPLARDNDGAAQRFGAQGGAAPAVALKYNDHGSDAVEKAAQFAREWKTLHAGGHTRMEEDRYVAINMEREGVTLKA